MKISSGYLFNVYETINIFINSTYINNLFWKIVFLLNDSSSNMIVILYIHFLFKIIFKNNFFKNFLIIIYIANISFLNISYINLYAPPILNKDLYNGLLIIHPILTYITIISYIFIFNYFVCLTRNSKFPKINKFKKNVYTLVIVSFFALLLGSLWAQQELNWGGWWNWDSVEIILLSFNILILFWLHLKKKDYKLTVNLNLLNRFFYALLFYIIVRSNVIVSVHAFSINLHLQKYFYIYFLTILLFFFLKTSIVSHKYFVKKNLKLYLDIFLFNVIRNKILKSSFLFSFINISIITITLFNIFLFFFKIKFNINLYKYISIFIKILIIFYLIFFKKYKLKWILLVLACLVVSDFFIFFLILNYLIYNNKVFFKKILHLLLVTTSYLMVSSCDVGTVNWILNDFSDIYNSTCLTSNYFLLSFNNSLNHYNLNLNPFFLKNNNIGDSLNVGYFFNFFSSNLFFFENKIFINYILEDQFIFKFNFILQNTVILLPLFIFNYFFKKNIVLKNGIV